MGHIPQNEDLKPGQSIPSGKKCEKFHKLLVGQANIGYEFLPCSGQFMCSAFKKVIDGCELIGRIRASLSLTCGS
jgi:hypothetical protein